MNKKELVNTLRSQHQLLREDLKFVFTHIMGEKINGEEIIEKLKKFYIELEEHLTLENGVFYVELLKDMKIKGQDTSKTEVFINEMKDIGNKVILFLQTFNTPTNIEKDPLFFRKEFSQIVDILTLRIEMEETEVYTYWELI